MKFYIDSADINEIKEANSKGWVDGVTTNPSLMAKVGRPPKEVIQDICKEVNGLISAEVFSIKKDEMLKEALDWAKVHDNVVVKIPMTEDGLCVVKELTAQNIKTNVTLVFSAVQALMAAKAGATLCSPFVGRIDDTGANGMDLIAQIRQIYDNYDIATEILVASIRHPIHVMESALIGADIVTIPFKVMQGLAKHPLTDKGLAQFVADAKKITQ